MPPGGMDLKILLNGSVDLFSHFTKCKNNKKVLNSDFAQN